MNPEYLHIVLNHIPTIGFGIGLGLYVIALFLKHEDLRRVGLVIFFLAAAVTVVTYVSGNDAREALKETEGISDALMQAHESAALIAFIFMCITGFFAWVGLWIWERPSRFTRLNSIVVLIFAVLSFALMARAAYFGGAIRHPELQAAETIPVDPNVPTIARAWGTYVADHEWAWPSFETLHFVGLCLLFGVVLTMNLRVLGIGRKVLSFAATEQLLPLGMLGFALNLITGMMFFVATPEQYTGDLFLLKMALIVAGAVNLLYFMLSGATARIGADDNAGIGAKVIAASAILIWIAVLFCGHMLPWLGNSF
jgi:hypothetical protein